MAREDNVWPTNHTLPMHPEPVETMLGPQASEPNKLPASYSNAICQDVSWGENLKTHECTVPCQLLTRLSDALCKAPRSAQVNPLLVLASWELTPCLRCCTISMMRSSTDPCRHIYPCPRTGFVGPKGSTWTLVPAAWGVRL